MPIVRQSTSTPGNNGSPTVISTRVERIPVLTQRVLDEPVVPLVLGRGEQRAVEADPATGVVHLILVPTAPRDLDQHVELNGLATRHGLNHLVSVRPSRTSDGYARPARERAIVAPLVCRAGKYG